MSKCKRQNKCFVPGCTTGYKSSKVKASLFAAPKDPERLKQWDKLIPRQDKALDESCVVCELHFEPHFVERHYKHIIQGEEIISPRGKPLLQSNACPTIFRNLPKYLSTSLPRKRTLSTSRYGKQQPEKK